MVQRTDGLTPRNRWSGCGWTIGWKSYRLHRDAGIAFQFNAPDACAPQAILLAVPPEALKAWTPGRCTGCCSKRWSSQPFGRWMRKLWTARSFDPVGAGGGVGEVAHFLPALCLAVNVEGDVVAPDLSSLT